MKKGLGRGLGALLDMDAGAEETGRMPVMPTPDKPGAAGVTYIDIRMVEPNQRQPRQRFDEAALQELADSIRSFGVIQPLIVKDCGGHYAIVAGERRFRAARMARLETLPVIVKDYSEQEILQIALIENIQREDLTPIEEAVCYKRLIEDFFFTPEAIAEKTGRNRSAVTAAVRLLELDQPVQALVDEGRLTASHARILLTVKENALQRELAEKIADAALSVRAAETLVTAALAEDKKEEAPKEPLINEDILQACRRAEGELRALLGTKVTLRYGKNKGKIEIEYVSPEELDRLLGLFKSAGGRGL